MKIRNIVLASWALIGCSASSGPESVEVQTQAVLGADITNSGTAIALVTNPADSFVPLSVIHDGVFPPQGSTDGSKEFDTYSGMQRTTDWLGYSFASPQTFATVVYQGGIQRWNGGWFSNIALQVSQNGVWNNVAGVVSTPPFAGNDNVNYETYTFSFPPVTGDGIRVFGQPGGLNTYTNTGEMRVYQSAGSSSDSGTDASADAARDSGSGMDVTADVSDTGHDVGTDSSDATFSDATFSDASNGGQDATVDSGRDAGGGMPGTDGGCGLSGAQTGQLTMQTTIAGVSRSYVVLVPTSYSSSTAVPLSFVFHEHGGSPASAMGFGLQNAASSAGSGAIFVFPQAIDPGGGASWDVVCSSNDVAFYDAMLSQLSSQYCIATNKVFASGFSAGADFAETVGCCRASTLRAVAPASGGLYADVSQCTTPAPAFRLTSGTQDVYFNQFDFANGVAYFQGANHCAYSASLASGAGNPSPSPCLQYNGCSSPVVWCNYSMPHQLPPTWAADTWAFFSGF
jgi:polyhydroxybutyrate depolymerase